MVQPPVLSISRRTRSTPFTSRVRAADVKGYTVYNHMLLPTVFDSLESDYHHLKSKVQVWDVACERQIEVRGRDALRLVQMLTPRDLRGMNPGACYYVPMVDETGGMLNDPVLLKLAEDRYWISIADSDLLYWIKGIAYGFRLEVDVVEPDVHPLAVQGPLAEDLMARVFGDAVRDIKFFRFTSLPFEGTYLNVARSGYSKQDGFEIYVNDWTLGEPLWDRLFEAGADLDVLLRLLAVERVLQLAEDGRAGGALVVGDGGAGREGGGGGRGRACCERRHVEQRDRQHDAATRSELIYRRCEQSIAPSDGSSSIATEINPRHPRC